VTTKILVVVAVVGAALLAVVGVRIVRHPAENVGGIVLTWDVDLDGRYEQAMPGEQALRLTASALRKRALALSPLARVEVHERTIEVDLPGHHDPDAVKRALARTGRIEFKLVDDASLWMRAVADRLASAPVAGIEVHEDSWSEHRDITVCARQRAQLEAVLARVAPPLPPDHELAYQLLTDQEGKPYWRSYYVFRAAVLGNADLERIDLLKNPDTRRPQMKVVFDPDGSQKLAAFTGGHLDRKVAIIIDGRVNDAPVISARIEDGEATIDMDSDNSHADAFITEAHELDAAVRGGALAAPLRKKAERLYR
jgi:preprotein translocase subunit SecD